MRFLKYFEAATYMGGSATPDELMVKYADDIVRVLPLYYYIYEMYSGYIII